MSEQSATYEVASPACDMVSWIEKAIAAAIDVEGVYPHICMSRRKDDTLTYASLALNEPRELLQHVARLLREGAQELVFGLDRYTKPGQGTRFDDVVTVFHWTGSEWRCGIVEYRVTPRTVLPINWNNAFWSQAMRSDIGVIEWHRTVRSAR